MSYYLILIEHNMTLNMESIMKMSFRLDKFAVLSHTVSYSRIL